MHIAALPLSIVAALGVAVPSGALAGQPDGLGPPRQLCIGDESECTKKIVTKLTGGSNLDLTVSFEYASASLTREAKVNLDAFAKALRDVRLRSSSFLVEGHTDAKGAADYNNDLSLRRARAVIDYLREQGIDTAKFTARGYGSQKPISGDPLASANRRVETRLRSE